MDSIFNKRGVTNPKITHRVAKSSPPDLPYHAHNEYKTIRSPETGLCLGNALPKPAIFFPNRAVTNP